MGIALEDVATSVSSASMGLGGFSMAREFAAQQGHWLATAAHAHQAIDAMQMADALRATHQVGGLAGQLIHDPMPAIVEGARNHLASGLFDDLEYWRNQAADQAKLFQPLQSIVDAYSHNSAWHALQDFATKEILSGQVSVLDRLATVLTFADATLLHIPDDINAMVGVCALQHSPALFDEARSVWGSQLEWKDHLSAIAGGIGQELAQMHANDTITRFQQLECFAQYEIGNLGVLASVADYLKPQVDYLSNLSSLGFASTSLIDDLDRWRSVLPPTFTAYSFDIDEALDVDESVEEVEAPNSDAEPSVGELRAATEFTLAEFKVHLRIAQLAARINTAAAADCAWWRPQFMLVLSVAGPRDLERLRSAFTLFEQRRARLYAPRGPVRGKAVETLTTEDIEEFDEAAASFLMALDRLARNLS